MHFFFVSAVFELRTEVAPQGLPDTFQILCACDPCKMLAIANPASLPVVLDVNGATRVVKRCAILFACMVHVLHPSHMYVMRKVMYTCTLPRIASGMCLVPYSNMTVTQK